MKHSFSLACVLTSGLVLTAAAQTSHPAAQPHHPAAQPAAATASAGPANIAVIGFQEAVEQTNEFQRGAIDLQTKFEPKGVQIKNLNDEVTSLEKQLQVQGDALSDTERATRARNIEDKKKQIQRLAEDAQSDFQDQMGQLYSTVAEKVLKVMTDYVQQQGYTAVLDATSQQGQVPFVFYAQPAFNITKAVTDAYNKASGVPAPPEEPAAPAPKPAAVH
jgi:outer membrane protein